MLTRHICMVIRTIFTTSMVVIMISYFLFHISPVSYLSKSISLAKFFDMFSSNGNVVFLLIFFLAIVIARLVVEIHAVAGLFNDDIHLTCSHLLNDPLLMEGIVWSVILEREPQCRQHLCLPVLRHV